MNQLQFSTKQLFIMLSATAASTVMVFSLGLIAASVIADKPESSPSPIALIDDRMPAAMEVGTDAELVQTPPVAAPSEAAVRQTPQPVTEQVRYGVQIAVFGQLENAIKFAGERHDADFQARIFSRTTAESKTNYPVLVGLFDNMDEAQQAKHAFHERFAADSFVTDATQLQEEIVLAPTVAMLP